MIKILQNQKMNEYGTCYFSMLCRGSQKCFYFKRYNIKTEMFGIFIVRKLDPNDYTKSQ